MLIVMELAMMVWDDKLVQFERWNNCISYKFTGTFLLIDTVKDKCVIPGFLSLPNSIAGAGR